MDLRIRRMRRTSVASLEDQLAQDDKSLLEALRSLSPRWEQREREREPTLSRLRRVWQLWRHVARAVALGPRRLREGRCLTLGFSLPQFTGRIHGTRTCRTKLRHTASSGCRSQQGWRVRLSPSTQLKTSPSPPDRRLTVS